MVTMPTRSMGIARVFELLQECKSELYVDENECDRSRDDLAQRRILGGIDSDPESRLHDPHILIPLNGAATGQVLERMMFYFRGAMARNVAVRMDSASRGTKDGSTRNPPPWELLKRELEAANGLGACETFRVSAPTRSCAFHKFHLSISAAVLFLFDGSSTEDLADFILLQKTLTKECARLDPLLTACIPRVQSCGVAESPPNCKIMASHRAIDRRHGCSEIPLLPTPGDFPEVCVWTNVCDARLAVIRESLAARFGYLERAPIFAAMAGPPSVLVLRVSSVTVQSVEELDDLLSDAETEDSAGRKLITDWQRACMGIAVLNVVDVNSGWEVPSVAEACLSSEVSEFNMSPILVVLSTSHDSGLSANIEGLRNACDKFNSRLHIEGPALVIAMQPSSVPNMKAGLALAHSVMLEVAEWFGFSTCGVVTYHHADFVLSCIETGSSSGTEQDDASDSGTSEIEVKLRATAGARNLIYGSGAASSFNLGPTLALWYFLSRMGLSRIRSLVELTSQLSDNLYSAVSRTQNLNAFRSGADSNVKLTYVMSRADKLLRKYKARQQVSNINRAIFEDSSDLVGLLTIFFIQNAASWTIVGPGSAGC
jgi:hypothetical protein